MSRRTTLASSLAALTALLALTPAAAFADKTASPTGTGTTCTWLAPCSLSTALASATAERVTLLTGTYAVSATLDLPAGAELVGDTVGARPRLVGASNLSAAVLSAKSGGTVRHLTVEATSATGDAATFQSTTAEDIVLRAAGGDGAKVVGGATPTILRDALVRTDAGGSYAALKLRDGPVNSTTELRNVTAMAPATDARAIRCESKVSRTTLVNVLARGGLQDIDASTAGAQCVATYSNFRTALSPGMAAGTGHQDAAPLFADADYRPAAGSPTIDAGTSDALLGATDADGRTRTVGTAPDIGAFEYQGAAGDPDGGGADGDPRDEPPTTATKPGVVPDAGTHADPATTPDLRGDAVLPSATAPRIGRDVSVVPVSGAVLVRAPGAKAFLPFAGGVQVPVGATVDTRLGSVRLTSAVDAQGRSQTGLFSGGVFVVRQKRAKRPYTDLVLTGGDFSSCKAGANRRRARTATAARAPRSMRRLWGKDRGGRFRTRGKHAVATVRGTEWLTEDSCAGTRVSVKEGAVDLEPRHGGRTKRVRAGSSRLVRPPARRR